jgi:hypothetical protein
LQQDIARGEDKWSISRAGPAQDHTEDSFLWMFNAAFNCQHSELNGRVIIEWRCPPQRTGGKTNVKKRAFRLPTQGLLGMEPLDRNVRLVAYPPGCQPAAVPLSWTAH